MSRLLGLKGLKDIKVAKGHVLADNLKTSRYVKTRAAMLEKPFYVNLITLLIIFLFYSLFTNLIIFV